LNTVPTIISASDFLTVKNDLFPMVAVVFSKTNSLAIKVRCLEAFGILCGGTLAGSTLPKSSSNVLDKFTVQEKIMPLLKGMKTKEPAVMMAALAVLKQVGVIAETEFLAVEALPILWSFSLGPLLNLQQFQEFMVEIKAVSHKIEQEQVKKLRDLATNSSNGTEAIRSNDLMSVQSSSDPFASQSVGEDDFERLVLGKGSAVQPALKSQVSLPASPNAWHSNPTSPMNNILQPQTNISRTITPDHSLGGFTPMKPTSPPPVNSWGTNSMQTMHHMQPSMPASNPWGSPPMAPFASSGWAPAPPPAMNSSIWNNTRPQTLQPTLLNRTVEQSVPLGNQFSLQPPPSVTSSVTSSVPQTPAPKAGLDKYESLI
jgi:SCY1-like protein 2